MTPRPHARMLTSVLACAVIVPGCTSDKPTAKAGLKFEATGPAPQGGIVDLVLVNEDANNPFDGAAPRMVSGAIAVQYKEVSPTRLAAVGLVDATAPIGPLRLEVVARNPRGESVTYASSSDDPAAPLISLAHAPLRLTPGTVVPNEAIGAPRRSNLYRIALPDDDQVFVMTFATVGRSLRTISGPRLVGAVAPSSGKFGEGFRFETTFDLVTGSRVAAGLLRRGNKAGDAFFAVHASDLSGGPHEYEYTMKVALSKGVPFSMKEPPTPDSPQAPLASIEIDGPAYALDGAIDRAEDADFVVFTPKKDGRMFVTATPVDAVGPLNVSIFGNDPGTANCTAYVAGGTGTTQAEAKLKGGTTYCARVNSTTRLTMPYLLVLTPELP